MRSLEEWDAELAEIKARQVAEQKKYRIWQKLFWGTWFSAVGVAFITVFCLEFGPLA